MKKIEAGKKTAYISILSLTRYTRIVLWAKLTSLQFVQCIVLPTVIQCKHVCTLKIVYYCVKVLSKSRTCHFYADFDVLRREHKTFLVWETPLE